jgi:L-fuculose-phosphate aldolase
MISVSDDIHEKHSHINSMIIAHPPNIMAFAITNAIFDLQMIPESYIMLLNIAKLPSDSSFMELEKVVADFTKETPLTLVSNDCVIATENTLRNAFERLKIAEYSAKAIITTKSIGKIMMINMIDNERIAEIKKAFQL